MDIPSRTPLRWGVLTAYVVGRLFTIVGFGAWGFILYQLYEIVRADLSPPGMHGGGENNLGADLAWLVLVGLVLIGVAVILLCSIVARGLTNEREDIRVLNFAAWLNGSLLGFTVLAALIISVFLNK